MAAHDIIIKPLLSEKSYAGIKDKKYYFIRILIPEGEEVSRQAVEKVEEIFGVKVDKVNTANVHGKLKRQGKYEGYTSDYKKAAVSLKKDSKSIEFFDSLS